MNMSEALTAVSQRRITGAGVSVKHLQALSYTVSFSKPKLNIKINCGLKCRQQFLMNA